MCVYIYICRGSVIEMVAAYVCLFVCLFVLKLVLMNSFSFPDGELHFMS